MTSQEQELLTRVARARWDKRREIGARYGFDIAKWDDLPGLDRDEEIECARAAIEAMMEPTQQMIEAGITADYNFRAERGSAMGFGGIYRAMLAASLSKGGE